MNNYIFHRDCISGIRQWRAFQLVFLDPPFNIGQRYKGYEDKRADYQEWLGDVLEAGWDRVAPGGVLVLHGSAKLRPVYWRATIEKLLDRNYEDEIIWHYRFGQHQHNGWIDNHCTWMVFRKPGAEKAFYPDNVLVESDRRSKYSDKRIAKSARQGLRTPGTVWGVPSDGSGWGRVTNGKERRHGHPNQLPEKLLERAVLAYTRRLEWVCDMFSGSGTLSAVCRKLERNSVAFDVSEESVNSGRERIDAVEPARISG